MISTMNMIQPGTGLIVAMAQSRPVMGNDGKKGETYWNLSVEPGDGRHPGLPGRLDLQGVHRGGCLEKGIPLSKKYNATLSMNFGGKPSDPARVASRSAASTR